MKSREFIVFLMVFICCIVVNEAFGVEDRNWSRVWGSVSNDYGFAVAVGGATNIYVAGDVTYPVDGQPIPGIQSIILRSYDADGNTNWTVLAGPIGSYAKACAVAVGPSNNVFITGQTWGPMDSQPEVGNGDFFLSKYKVGGSLEWTRIWGSTSVDQGNAVVIDGEGNAYVAGYARGSVHGQQHVNSDDFCLTKFNSEGSNQWTRMWGGTNGATGREAGRGVALDSQTNVYVAGYSDTSVDGQPFSGTYAIVLTKFDVDGTKQWTRMWGASFQKGHATVVDAQDMVYVAGLGGSFNGQVSQGSTDPFLLKVDGTGSHLWTRMWGSSGDDWGRGLGVNDDGVLYITGTAAYGKTFDGQGGDEGGAFLTDFTSAGVKQTTKRWGASGTEGYAVACSGTDVVYVAGATYGAFDGQTMIG